MKKCNVFMDLENIIRLKNGGGDLIPETEAFLERFLRALREQNWELCSLTAAASTVRDDCRVGDNQKDALRNVFSRRRFKIVLGTAIADSLLVRAIRAALDEDALQKSVLLLSSDGDFIPIISELVESGREVIVLGHQMNKSLHYRATQCVSLQEFFGDDAQAVLEHKRTARKPHCPFNGINIPLKLFTGEGNST